MGPREGCGEGRNGQSRDRGWREERESGGTDGRKEGKGETDRGRETDRFAGTQIG